MRANNVVSKKIVVGLAAIAVVGVLVGSNAACGANFCGAGQVPCGSGCMPSGADCCDSAGDYCDNGKVCDGNLCVGGGGGYTNPCDGCLAEGQECCQNINGTVGCAPLGASCCGNNTYCPSGYVCGGSCGSPCCP